MQLLEMANILQCPEWQKLIIILIDEMYIKEGLVYKKHSGELVGFTDLGDVSNHLIQFEMAARGEERAAPMLAKTVMHGVHGQGYIHTIAISLCHLPLQQGYRWASCASFLESYISSRKDDIQGNVHNMFAGHEY